jgi:hypothetical protein
VETSGNLYLFGSRAACFFPTKHNYLIIVFSGELVGTRAHLFELGHDTAALGHLASRERLLSDRKQLISQTNCVEQLVKKLHCRVEFEAAQFLDGRTPLGQRELGRTLHVVLPGQQH